MCSQPLLWCRRNVLNDWFLLSAATIKRRTAADNERKITPAAIKD